MPATAWKVRDKVAGGSGPAWENSDTANYENLIDQVWEWTATWEVFAKSTSDTGVLWGAVPNTWATYSFVLKESAWSMFTNTKIQSDTSWTVNAKTKVQAATET